MTKSNTVEILERGKAISVVHEREIILSNNVALAEQNCWCVTNTVAGMIAVSYDYAASTDLTHSFECKAKLLSGSVELLLAYSD